MIDWLDNLLMLGSGTASYGINSERQLPQACVLVSVVHTRGSCPRNAGTRMVVALDTFHGTIGGGHLEFQALVIARELPSRAKPDFCIERFPLGARVGQCCGGVVHLSFDYIPVVSPPWVVALKHSQHIGQAAVLVTALDDPGLEHKLVVTEQSCVGCLSNIWEQQRAVEQALDLLGNVAHGEPVRKDTLLYEVIGNTQLQIAIFGAGHVGKALVNVLSSLPCRILWIDSRATEFPDHIPTNVQVEIADQPEREVDDLPADTRVVVMTHSHSLDQAICERVLHRTDLAWCGLIGSITKRRQFEKRLLARGLPETALQNLTCPIGINGITGKHPAEIAISVAAQLMQSRHAQQRVDALDHQAA